MTPRILRSLFAAALVLMPIVGILGLRAGGRQIHTSSVRLGAPTVAAAWLMGPRHGSSETELQALKAMDQYWFAFEDTDEDTLRRIALDMASGEHSLGARTVVCMSNRVGLSLEQARNDEAQVCTVGGGEDDLGVPRCKDEDWNGQGGRLVLLSVAGQDARLDRTELIDSCRVNARHWHEWNQRQ